MGEPSTTMPILPSSSLEARISGFSVVPTCLKRELFFFVEKFRYVGGVQNPVDLDLGEALFDRFYQPFLHDTLDIGQRDRRLGVFSHIQHLHFQLQSITKEVSDLKHITTINKANLKASAVKGGCGKCQSSCQSACKTSCTVANQKCESEK